MGINRAVIHLEDLVAHAVEEITVVSDHKQRHIRLREVVLKPLHHLHVEVVGRLVEKQHVGVVEKHQSESQTFHLSARQSAYLLR